MGLPWVKARGLHRAQILAKLRVMVWSHRHKGSAVPTVKVASSTVINKVRTEIIIDESLRAEEPYKVEYAMRSKANSKKISL